MNYLKIIFIILFFSFYVSCANYKINKTSQEKEYYNSNGFALIYEEELYNQKIIKKRLDNDSLHVISNLLKKSTPIEILNPLNGEIVETEIYFKGDFPDIFKVVISKKIASILQLDAENPYVEISEIKLNKKFVAKESNIFDEERNVAEKAPVDEIQMDDITKNKLEKKTKPTKINSFTIIVSDFYYENSANDLMKSLIQKTNMNNISVKKINNTKYRLLVGPFRNFNALKTVYISLNKLGFENLNILQK